VGCGHHKPNRCYCRRPRARICLRKGCGRKYTPRCWNQCYCQDPECLRLVRRWQAAKRQAKLRQDEAVKARHAQAQRARRRRVISLPQPPKKPKVAAARGHAAKIFFPRPFCDRPGCFESPLKSNRNQAKYCCAACRRAVGRVLDRERKWLKRGTFQGRQARQREYQAAQTRRCGTPRVSGSATSPRAPPAQSVSTAEPVRRRWPWLVGLLLWDRVVGLHPVLTQQECQA
jgi:hypothetical protein